MTWVLLELVAGLVGLGVGWVFGGAAVLWGSARWIARIRDVSYWGSILGNLAGGASAAPICILLAAAGMRIGGVLEPVLAWGGLLVGGAALVLVVGRFLRTTLGRAMLACALMPLVYAAVFAAVGPLTHRVMDLDWVPICESNLDGIGHVIAVYQSRHGGEVPQDLDVLLRMDQPRTLFVCPASGRRYFYLAPKEYGKGCARGRMIACDLEGNHPSGVRNVLYANGVVRCLSEEEFQRELGRPENTAFAEQLRKGRMERP